MDARAERRRQTEMRILAAARALFAERGFDRTTIRSVAKAAAVDPALVMRYFGSKQQLFGEAVRAPVEPTAERPEEIVEQVLATLGVKIGGLPQASRGMLRSMLTHPETAEQVRATLDRQVEEIGAAIAPADAPLRAALMIATMLGVTIGRELLDIGALRNATSTQIADLLRPGFEALAATAPER